MSAESWTVRKVLLWTQQHFEKKLIESPRLTAEVLLAHVLNADRVRLYTDLDRPLDKSELSSYRGLIERRMAGEPTQYLTGHREFYGRPFGVDARVLVPRPETELLVEAALSHLPKDTPTRVLDLCTGSGCIAVTIAAERPLASVLATDLSAGAVVVARANAERHGVGSRVTVVEGDLFAAVPSGARFDVVVSNPPYVPSGQIDTLSHEVRREPRTALDGGPSGLDVLGRIIREAPGYLKPGGRLALELGEDQGEAVRDLLETQGAFDEVRLDRDLARLWRLAVARRSAA